MANYQDTGTLQTWDDLLKYQVRLLCLCLCLSVSMSMSVSVSVSLSVSVLVSVSVSAFVSVSMSVSVSVPEPAPAPAPVRLRLCACACACVRAYTSARLLRNGRYCGPLPHFFVASRIPCMQVPLCVLWFLSHLPPL